MRNTKTNIKALYVIVIMLIFIGLLVGCSQGDEESIENENETNTEPVKAQSSNEANQGTTSTEEEKGEISFLLVNPALYEDVTDNEYIDRLKEISGYDLTYEFFAGFEETQKQLALRFASGDLPDVVRTAHSKEVHT